MGKRAKIAAKKKCCKDKPRCASCPVVLMRLEQMGYAEKLDGRTFRLEHAIPAKVFKLARQR